MIVLGYREVGENVLEVTRALRKRVAELNDRNFAPEGLELAIVADQEDYIEGALTRMRDNLFIGALLAVLALLVFLRSFGASLLIALTIPLCIAGTVLGMEAVGRSVNVVSLAGMAFAVGMVIDNSIVVLESIDSCRAQLRSATEAALVGVRRVWAAILASTATTAVVFLPMLSWQDEIGQLLRDVAVALSFSVGISFLAAVLFIPSFAARLLPAQTQRPTTWLERLGDRIRQLFTRQVAWLIHRRIRALLGLGFGIAGCLWIARSHLPPLEYAPKGDRNLLYGVLVPPPGYSSQEIRRVAQQVQADVMAHTGVERDGVAAIRRSFFVGDPTRVFAGGAAEDPERLDEVVAFYRRALKKVPDMIAVASRASLFGRNVGTNRSIDVHFSGAKLEELSRVAKIALGRLRKGLPGGQIRPIPSLSPDGPEYRFRPKREFSAGLAVSGRELALWVDALADGAIIGKLAHKGEVEIDVVLRASPIAGDSLVDPDALLRVPVTTGGGAIVPLASLADYETGVGPAKIQHIERRRAITLRIAPPDRFALEEAIAVIEGDVLPSLEQEGLFAGGVDVRVEGTASQLDQAKGRMLRVLLAALLVAYLLLAALFEDFIAPVAVFVSVPLAAAGGLYALHLVDQHLGGQSLDMMTAIGFVILIGVVVNNAILIVDGARRRRADGQPVAAAIRDAVESRVRPIFMSSMTSLAGLLPLILASGSGASLYRGVGAIVLGGLALSTFLTIYLTPCALRLLWPRDLR